MIDERQRLFGLLVKRRLDRAKRQKGFKFIGLRNIIKRRGAVAVAKSFLSEHNTGNLNDGLRLLVRAGLSDLSVEQAVIDCEKFKLFSKKEVLSANKRLKFAKAFFDKK